MAPERTKGPVTYEDLVRVPAPKVAEILEGDLYATPRPAIPHAIAAASLLGSLINPFQNGEGGPGGWWILMEPELHLAADVVVPDLGGWRREQLERLPAVTAMTIAPAWVCEILSPSTEAIDRSPKLRIYGREGVGHVWLINPITRLIEVFRLEGGRWALVRT